MIIKETPFVISWSNFCWIDSSADNREDLCLHGEVTVTIGDTQLSYSCCTSAAALQMLRTLTQDHKITPHEQMLPCCGHSLFASDDLRKVTISGCDNGIDYSVTHKEDTVIIETEEGILYTVSLLKYRAEVLRFSRAVEKFYRQCSPKILPNEPYEKNGYFAFWNEWTHHMFEAMCLFENQLLNQALLSTHCCKEFQLDCGNPYDNSLNTRKEYIDACSQLAINLYMQQHFANNLAVIYEDKYNCAVKNEKDFIELCLTSVESQSYPFHWMDEEETYYGIRHIWKANRIDIETLFRKIITSDLGDNTELDCSVYIIDIETGTVFFLYDDRGMDIFYELN